MSAVCTVPDCGSTDTRPYICGVRCAQHTPAVQAGRLEPPARDESMIPTPLHRTLPSAKGATDVNKERPGGYVSRQRAERIATTADALRAKGAGQAAAAEVSVDAERALQVLHETAKACDVLSANTIRDDLEGLRLRPAAIGALFRKALDRGWIEHVGYEKSQLPSTRGHDIKTYRSLIRDAA